MAARTWTRWTTLALVGVLGAAQGQAQSAPGAARPAGVQPAPVSAAPSPLAAPTSRFSLDVSLGGGYGRWPAELGPSRTDHLRAPVVTGGVRVGYRVALGPVAGRVVTAVRADAARRDLQPDARYEYAPESPFEPSYPDPEAPVVLGDDCRAVRGASVDRAYCEGSGL